MRFGLPRLEREKVISDRLKLPSIGAHPVEVNNVVLQLPVIEIPIELPRYRLQNGRTASLQLEDIAKNGLPPDFFRADSEADDAQVHQHQLLFKLVDADKGIKKSFYEDKKHQVDPILIDHSGFVVNGNRRLCYWRHLLSEAPAEFAHFNVIRAAVLPATIGESEIRRIESRLQLQADIREDYEWHARANMYKNLMKELKLDTKQVADQFELNKREIESLIRMLELGQIYLDSRGISNQWSALDGKEFGFRRLVIEEQQTERLPDKQILHQTAFLVIDGTKEFGDRAWALIPKIRTALPEWKGVIEANFDIPKPRESVSSPNPFLGAGSNPSATDASLATFLSESSQETRTDIREKLVEFLEDLSEKRDVENKSTKLQKGLRMAAGNVKAAAEFGLVQGAVVAGCTESIEEIRRALSRIEEWLKSGNLPR